MFGAAHEHVVILRGRCGGSAERHERAQDGREIRDRAGRGRRRRADGRFDARRLQDRRSDGGGKRRRRGGPRHGRRRRRRGRDLRHLSGAPRPSKASARLAITRAEKPATKRRAPIRYALTALDVEPAPRLLRFVIEPVSANSQALDACLARCRRTSSRKRSVSGRSSGMMRPSMRTIGTTSAAVPVKNASSHAAKSARVIVRTFVGMPSSRAISSTDARVMPSRMSEPPSLVVTTPSNIEKKVLAAAFGDVTAIVEQDRFVESARQRIGEREDRVRVVSAGLHPRRQCRRRRFHDRRHGRRATRRFFTFDQPAERQHRDEHVRFAHVRRRETHRVAAEERQRPDVGGVALAGFCDFDDDLAKALGRKRHLQTVGARAAIEAVDVILQTEDRRTARRRIQPDALEHARPVVQRVGEPVDRNGGVGLQLPVDTKRSWHRRVRSAAASSAFCERSMRYAAGQGTRGRLFDTGNRPAPAGKRRTARRRRRRRAHASGATGVGHRPR